MYDLFTTDENLKGEILTVYDQIDISLEAFKTCMLGRGFHTFIKNVLFPSLNDMKSHNPPPSRPSVFASICSPLQSMWDPPIYPFRGPTSLLAHRLVFTPLRGSASSLAHRKVSCSILFVTAQGHRYQLLFSLGFPFQTSPQGF